MSFNAEASSSKHKERKNKDKSKEHKHKDKKSKKEHKKASGGHKTLRKAAQNAESPFEHRIQRMRLSVPPKHAADWLAGVKETLDSMLMRYVGQMGGVLLAHWEHEIMDDTVKIINECPYGVCEVSFHAIVWSPKVGQVLHGTHSLSSPSHLSLLFAKTFNVSIPLDHIPQDKYEFEHSDLPEEEDESSDEEEEDMFGESVHEVGRWKDTASGKIVGEGGERVAFTVIGLHVTNHMLSLTGSLLADPSKPETRPEVAAVRVPSLSPDLPEPPAKKARTAPRKSNTQSTPAKRAAPAAEPATPAIDESKLTARELKKLRKEQEKAKRDARKARKEGGDEEETAGSSLKRKADESAEDGTRKKRK